MAGAGLGRLLKSHAPRTYGAGTGPNTDGAAALLTKIQARVCRA